MSEVVLVSRAASPEAETPTWSPPADAAASMPPSIRVRLWGAIAATALVVLINALLTRL